MFVDAVRGVTLILLPCIDWTPFSVPHAQVPLVHPFSLLLVAPPQPPALLIGPNIGFWGGREAVRGVVVDGVTGVFPILVRITEVREIGCKGVAVEEDGMIGVDRADGFVDTVVECYNTGVGGVGRFVERVVTSYPFISFVVCGECLPEPDGAILKILVVPDLRCEPKYG